MPTNRDFFDLLTATVADLDSIHTRLRTLPDDGTEAYVFALWRLTTSLTGQMSSPPTSAEIPAPLQAVTATLTDT